MKQVNCSSDSKDIRVMKYISIILILCIFALTIIGIWTKYQKVNNENRELIAERVAIEAYYYVLEEYFEELMWIGEEKTEELQSALDKANKQIESLNKVVKYQDKTVVFKAIQQLINNAQSPEMSQEIFMYLLNESPELMSEYIKWGLDN